MVYKISAGVILTDGYSFLVGHSTGNDFYDIPKGNVNDGESARSASVRETKEETSVILNPQELIDLGVFDYNRSKKLHLFLMKTLQLPSLDKMICTSFFWHPKKEEFFPEADYFKYIKFEEKEVFLTHNLCRVIGEVEKKYPYFFRK